LAGAVSPLSPRGEGYGGEEFLKRVHPCWPVPSPWRERVRVRGSMIEFTLVGIFFFAKS